MTDAEFTITLPSLGEDGATPLRGCCLEDSTSPEGR
jgi:hypothetical protein